MVRVLIVSAFALAGGILAANAHGDFEPACVTPLVSKKLLVFANACSPADSFTLVIKELPAFAPAE